MPTKKFFVKLAGAALLGAVSLLIAGIIFLLLLPYLLWIALGTILLIVVFLVIWGAVYACIYVGTAIYYVFKPMKVSKKKKGYSVAKAKEAGRRRKGATRKRR
jgi:hypothetical protein